MINTNYFFTLIAFQVMPYLFVHSQTVRHLDDFVMNTIDAAVTTEMFASDLLPGVSVGIIYNGKVVYTKGYGNAGPNTNTTTSTKYPIASVSKTITGILAMRMVANGHLGIDSTIDKYVPGYNNTTITIRHLLAHQSGIGHYNNCPDGYEGPFQSGSSLFTVQRCSQCMQPPGSGTIYTTFGSTLLGVIIDLVGQNVYGKGYIQLYNEWIRNAGNITNLTAEHDNLVAGMATGYDSDGDENSGYWNDIGWKLPAGGFVSNAHDLAKYGAGVMSYTFLDSATSNSMWVPQPTTGSPNNFCNDALAGNFGLAFAVADSGQNLRILHAGLNDHGYSTFLYLYPRWKTGIVLLANRGDKTGALNNIINKVESFLLCPQKREFHTTINWSGNWIYEANVIEADNVITTTNGSFVFDGGNRVVLKPGFHALAGTTFRAIIDGCQGSVNPY